MSSRRITMNHMTGAEEALTPLAELFMENDKLVANLKQLHAMAETAFQDTGDDLDGLRALRDTTIYLIVKMREDRLNNPNYAQQTHKRFGKRPAANVRAYGKMNPREKARRAQILEFFPENGSIGTARRSS